MVGTQEEPAVKGEHQFALRLVSIDYYMTRPTPGLDECYSQQEGRTIDQVPVIRIFGATPSGQKTCVHVHGAFPYLYVPLETALPETPAEVDAYLRRLAASIEAGSIATTDQGAPIRRQRVFAVQLVRARKFYGYHAEEQLFVKFLLYNPMDVARVATMLQSGQVLGQAFQPHESHIPFLLQFKIDFNLFGMGHLRLEEVFFREPVPDANLRKRHGWKEVETVVHHEMSPSGEALLQSSQLSGSQSRRWLADSIPSQWLPENLPSNIRLPERQSCCELEIDTCVEHIFNRRQLVRTRLEEASQREQLVESLIPMWDEERQRCGRQLPDLPGSPPRSPGPLCKTVEDVRAQFQAIADAQAAQQEAAVSAATPASQRRSQSVSTPAPVSSASRQTLLISTPAANLATSARNSGSPVSPDWAHAPVRSMRREEPHPEMQEGNCNMWGESTEEITEEVLGAEMHELMEWMHHAENRSDDDDVDPLLSLAQYAGTQLTPGMPPVGQQNVLERAQSQYFSQAEREANDILDATQDEQFPSPPGHRQLRMASRPTSGTERPGSLHQPEQMPYDPGDVEDLPGGSASPTGVFAGNSGDADWQGLSSQLDRALAAAQQAARDKAAIPQRDGSSGGLSQLWSTAKQPWQQGCWKLSPHITDSVDFHQPGGAMEVEGVTQLAAASPMPPGTGSVRGYDRRCRSSFRRRAKLVFTAAERRSPLSKSCIPQLDGGRDAKVGEPARGHNRQRGRSSQAKSPANSGASQQAEGSQPSGALAVQLSESAAGTEAAQSASRASGRAAPSGDEAEVSHPTRDLRGEGTKMPHANAPFRPPRRKLQNYLRDRARAATGQAEATGTSDKAQTPIGAGQEAHARTFNQYRKQDKKQEARSGSSYALLQLQATKDPLGAAAIHAHRTRSQVDVRRTHALATAARSFLKSPDSSGEASNNSERAETTGAGQEAGMPVLLPDPEATPCRGKSQLQARELSAGEAHVRTGVAGNQARPVDDVPFRRPTADVRRTHALATAARSFLRGGGDSSDDNSDNGAARNCSRPARNADLPTEDQQIPRTLPPATEEPAGPHQGFGTKSGAADILAAALQVPDSSCQQANNRQLENAATSQTLALPAEEVKLLASGSFNPCGAVGQSQDGNMPEVVPDSQSPMAIEAVPHQEQLKEDSGTVASASAPPEPHRPHKLPDTVQPASRLLAAQSEEVIPDSHSPQQKQVSTEIRTGTSEPARHTARHMTSSASKPYTQTAATRETMSMQGDALSVSSVRDLIPDSQSPDIAPRAKTAIKGSVKQLQESNQEIVQSPVVRSDVLIDTEEAAPLSRGAGAVKILAEFLKLADQPEGAAECLRDTALQEGAHKEANTISMPLSVPSAEAYQLEGNTRELGVPIQSQVDAANSMGGNKASQPEDLPCTSVTRPQVVRMDGELETLVSPALLRVKQQTPMFGGGRDRLVSKPSLSHSPIGSGPGTQLQKASRVQRSNIRQPGQAHSSPDPSLPKAGFWRRALSADRRPSHYQGLQDNSPDHAGTSTPPKSSSAAESSQRSLSRSQELLVMKPLQSPPSQAELDATMARHGLLPILAAVPHYGNPADAPAKAPGFSGIQYKLPTAAVSELRPFRSGNSNTACAMQRLMAQLPPQPELEGNSAGVYRIVTARSPPTPEAVSEWLRALRLSHRQVHGSQTSSPASFGMDPNTGKLLPREALGQDSSTGAARDSDLLGTPAFASPELGPTAQRLRARSRLAITSQPVAPSTSQSQAEDDQHCPKSPKYDERSGFFTPAPKPKAPEEEAVRPSSPKYDERTFFYTTPQVQLPPKSAAAAASSPWHQATRTLAEPGVHDSHIKPPLPGKRKQGLFDGGSFAKRPRWVSQITGPSPQAAKSQTPVSQAGFRWRVAGKGQQLTLLSIEVHADSRGSLLPDPRYDAVRAIVMAVMDDDEIAADLAFTVRMMLFDEKTSSLADGLGGMQMEAFGSERELLEAFVAAVRALDPDILLGWEVQQGSLGYLVDRAALLELPLLREISRTPEIASIKERQNDEYGQLHASGLHSAGRVILNMWRLLRSEIKLNIYTFESCVSALLQLRTPHTPPWLLTQCFNGGPAGGRWRTLEYWSKRARLNLAMLEQLDLIGRTGELARAFGIDFFSVLTRGSQYRVESLLVRLAHSQNYLMLSPSREQVGRQPAMECIPLVMEPESTMYSDPVIVLDYQSLYPSQIIAYNLCFCTCLGRPMHAKDPSQAHKLGASSLCLPAGTLQGNLAPDRLTVSPNGIAWAPPEARAGVVPRLLQEILQTRIMVKAAMKRHPPSAKVLQRVLNARQFGLKLIANVTYGYAAAGFSGRMPMAELADGIVQSGRQTLENTIVMVESHPEWRARVVYGDTDSLFVLLPGRSRADAFRIGADIAAMATAANPPPVTLKMEKVYQPCVLASKKRYVGYMYESPGQVDPAFDAKGIETVRRDSCPVVAKMLERSIRVLFSTHDLSQVKEYAERQWSKILSGRVSLADFVFAKEVRLGTYSGKGPAPPAAIVAAKAMAQDPRTEPRFSERVPYIVVHGAPGARLVDMVVPPQALVEAAGKLRLHAVYYISKQIIPALERVLNLVGGDPRAWFTAMSRPHKLLPQKRPPAALPITDPGRPGSCLGTIDQYYLSRHCAVCDALTHAAQPLCEACRQNPQLATAVLSARCSRLDRHSVTLVRICLHCGGGGARPAPPPGGSIACDSLDCAVFFERRKTAHELASAIALRNAGLELLEQA